MLFIEIFDILKYHIQILLHWHFGAFHSPPSFFISRIAKKHKMKDKSYFLGISIDIT
jgi:hypothetical protein